MTDTGHAVLSPSSSSRWGACEGSVVLEADEPNKDNAYSLEGTLAHALAAHCLINKLDAKSVLVLEHKGKQEIISQEMAEYTQEYLDFIWPLAAGHHLLVEQALDLEWITGEKGAKGTADAVIISDDGDLISVYDFKYGFNEVEAANNSQLRMYGLAALDQFGMLGDFKKIRLGIHQPRIDNVDDDETITIAELRVFEAELREAIKRVEKARKSNSLDGYLHPGDVQCKYCRAAYKCPALASVVAIETGADFDNVEQATLIDPPNPHKALLKADLIETFIKGCRAKVEADLFSGKPSDHWKLVEGKRGNRSYTDEKAIEAKLKAAKIKKDDSHETSLVTPAKLEKKLKAKHSDVWVDLQEYISQKPGKPSVAAKSDPRSTYTVDPGADFSEVE